jgi:hypothetical protein
MSDLTELTMENLRPCGCGRSSTGFCVGLHSLTDEEYDRYIMEGHVYPDELPKEKSDES